MGKSHFGAVGNVNMRGKKHLLLSCRCCSCTDLRETKETRRILRELRDAVAMKPRVESEGIALAKTSKNLP